MSQEMNQETFDFTDLGERLRGPDGHNVASASLARLAQLKDAVAGKLAVGLPPGEYERHQDLAAALAAAGTVMLGISSIMNTVPGATSGSSPATKGE